MIVSHLDVNGGITLNNLDILLLNKPSSSKPEYIVSCLESVKNESNVYILENDYNNIARAEVECIKNTNNKYFGFLDNDDILIPEKIPAMLDVLESNPTLCGVYSTYEQIDNTGRQMFIEKRYLWSATNQLCLNDYPNHFAIFRRSALNMQDVESTYSDFNEYYKFVLSVYAAKFGPWKFIPTIAYKRRERDHYINHRRPISPEIRSKAMQIAIPILTKTLIA